MSEINSGDVNSSETNEVSEVSEDSEFGEVDEELSKELDAKYDGQLKNASSYEHKSSSEVKEAIESKGKKDSSEETLDSELDKKYNEYIENKPLDSEVDNAEATPERIKCRNEELAGQEHPETGVPFEKRQVEVEGKQYEVVVPQFESAYDAQLPEDKLKSSDREQFKECNSQLKEAVENDSELRGKFDEEQLEQIENGDTPDGYTWHHDADVGKMQLVDTETHQKTGHTGGRSIWGGGTECR